MEWLHGGGLEVRKDLLHNASSLTSGMSASQEASKEGVGIGSASNDRDAGGEEEEDEDDEFCELEVGSVGKLVELKAAAARAKTLLNGNVTRSERQLHEKRLAEASRAAATLERTLSRRRWAALAHGLRAYDGVARVCKGTSCVGTGNAQASKSSLAVEKPNAALL